MHIQPDGVNCFQTAVVASIEADVGGFARPSLGLRLFAPRQYADGDDAPDQIYGDGLIERKLQIALRPRVRFHCPHEAVITSYRRIDADMPSECCEVNEDTVLLERGHSITDSFLSQRCGKFHRLSYLLENFLEIGRETRDVFIHSFGN